jgi:hypothetical protein
MLIHFQVPATLVSITAYQGAPLKAPCKKQGGTWQQVAAEIAALRQESVDWREIRLRSVAPSRNSRRISRQPSKATTRRQLAAERARSEQL